MSLTTDFDRSKELLVEKFDQPQDHHGRTGPRYEERFTAMDEKTSLALAGSEKAVSKAETATEKRFDAVNEFRGTLSDQTATLLPRAEASARFAAYDGKFEDVKKELGSLRESRSSGEGKEKGVQHNITMIFAVIATLISLATLLALVLQRTSK